MFHTCRVVCAGDAGTSPQCSLCVPTLKKGFPILFPHAITSSTLTKQETGLQNVFMFVLQQGFDISNPMHEQYDKSTYCMYSIRHNCTPVTLL